MSLRLTTNIDPVDKDYIRNKLIAFNVLHFPEELNGRYQELRLHLVDEAGGIIGGIVGEFCWNWLEVHLLYVDEAHRKSGHGRTLLREAERMAVERACDFIKLDTLSFQALDFYLKEGFHVYGTIENAGGHSHYYLKKDLKRAEQIADEIVNAGWMPLAQLEDTQIVWAGARVRLYDVGLNVASRAEDYYEYLVSYLYGNEAFLQLTNLSDGEAGNVLCVVEKDAPHHYCLGKSLKSAVGTERTFVWLEEGVQS